MFVQLVMAAMTTSPCLISKLLVVPLDRHAAEAGIGGGGRRMGGGLGSILWPPSPSQRPSGEPLSGERFRVNGGERFAPGRLHVRECDAVLRPLWAGEAWLDRRKIEAHDLGERGNSVHIRAEQALFFRVAFDEIDFRLRAASLAEVAKRLVIDGEEAHRGAVLGRHVADRGAVGDGHRRDAGAEELDELADDFFLAQNFGDGEHEVGRGRAGRQFAGKFHADDFGQQHVNRLAEHDAFGFDAADAPADDAEAVDHRGVAIGADAANRGTPTGTGLLVLAQEHDLRQVFEIHLVDDAGAGRNDAEVVECLLAPAEELVTLAVAGELHIDIELERVGRVEVVDLHRVVDDEIDGHERIDFLGIAAEALHGGSHGGEIDDARHAGEILQHNAGRLEWDFDLGRGGGLPRGEGFHIILRYEVAVAIAEQRFEQHADRIGQGGDVAEAGVLEFREAINAGFAAAGVESVAGLEGVEFERRGHGGILGEKRAADRFGAAAQ